MKFTVEIRDYEPGSDRPLTTADVEEAVQARLDAEMSDGYVLVEAADEEARAE